MKPSRRTMLRAAGSTVALPFLPSLGRKAFAADPKVVVPKRMMFIAIGFGVTSETWFPDKKSIGFDFPMTEGLKPLERHRNRFSIIQGLSHKHSNEGHWGSTFWLTGANRYAAPGSSFSNTISVDQVAAEAFGRNTRFTSLQFSGKESDLGGHGPGLSLGWNRQGKPIAGIDSPVAAFDKLFGDDTVPVDERRRLLRKQKSVLDAVLEEATWIDRHLSRRDHDKLDEYLQSIRDIEARLAKEESWMTTPKPKAPLAAPVDAADGEREIRLMYDLMVAALQVDSARVVTYRQPVNNLLKAMGVTVGSHDMSHYSPGPRMEASQQRDRKQSELLASLLDKLEGVKEADGSSLLDNLALTWGSNIRSIHYLDNCPTLIAGGGAGIKQGRHIVLSEKQTPLCNLWLTLLQGVGLDARSFGDSTGTLRDLIA